MTAFTQFDTVRLIPASTENEIMSHIETVTGYAINAYNIGIDKLNALASKDYAIDWTKPIWEDVDDGGLGGVSPSRPTTPDTGSIVLGEVNFDGIKPVYEDTTVDTGDAPEYVEKDYGFTVPTAPTVSWPVFSKTSPNLTDIQTATKPEVPIPAVPSITDVTIPDPPTYNEVEFEGSMPVDDITAPTVDFSWGESYYSSLLNDLLKDKLYSNITNGGTGLSEATEQAIYDRATSRLEEEEQVLIDSIKEGFSASGFPLPPGAFASALLEAENKILRARTDLNNDILVQQSKLAQDNTHFMYEKGIQFEQVMIGYHNEVQTRALDAAKTVVTAAIQMYAAKVEGYKAKVAAYGILAEVYKARIQGELAKAELYKAQIAGVQATVQVKALLVDAYRSQVEASKTLMEIYRIEMEGARIQAEIDRTKIEAFVAEVQAYREQVNAGVARYEGYKAQVEGELGKVEMAKADAQVYESRVNGYAATARTKIAEAELVLAKIKSQSDVYLAAIERYKADVQKAIAEVDAKVKIEELEVTTYQAETQMYNAELDALSKAYYGKVEEIKAKLDIAAKEADTAVRALLGKYELVNEATKGAAQVAGQLAASMASAANASISANVSESTSDNYNQSVSRTWSESESTSTAEITEHIYQHSD